jgi:hypothetical protein
MSENPKIRGHLRDPNVDGRIILNTVSKKYVVRIWTGFIRLETGLNGWLL